MPTTNPQIDELIETFEFLDDWEQRYAYLIDIGKNLPPMDESLKNENTLVRGCQSRVWLVGKALNPDAQQNGQQKHIQFVADSDAHIVRGLIGLLQKVYNNQPATFVAEYDAADLFNTLGLAEHLSPTRRTGLAAMVKRIKTIATEAAA